MNYTMKLNEEPFERIASGKKTIEVRLFDEKRSKINIGDTITFFKLPDLKTFVNVEVIGLSRFKDFKRLFSVFGTKPFNHPIDFTIEKQIKGMREIYSQEKENEFGVLGIHMKLIKPI